MPPLQCLAALMVSMCNSNIHKKHDNAQDNKTRQAGKFCGIDRK